MRPLSCESTCSVESVRNTENMENGGKKNLKNSLPLQNNDYICIVNKNKEP